MIRNLKITVAMVAVLALSAVGASAAQASTSGLDIEAVPATLTGSQVTQNKFILGESGTSVTCTTVTGSATTTTTEVHELTLTPFYGTPSEKTCKLGGLAASVEVGACRYTITDTETAGTFKVDITSCGTGAITIKNTTCTVTVGNQGPLSHITIPVGEAADALATLNVTGITYTGSSGCPANVVGTHTDGKLTGTLTIQAFEDKSGGVEGNQVNIKVT